MGGISRTSRTSDLDAVGGSCVGISLILIPVLSVIDLVNKNKPCCSGLSNSSIQTKRSLVLYFWKAK